MSFRSDADNSVNFVSFKPNEYSDFQAATQNIASATGDIKTCMPVNELKLNDSKGEILGILL